MFAAQHKLPPIARNTDDVTSHLAAVAHTDSGKRGRHCAIVLRAIRMHPGETSHELSARCGLERHEVARRCPDLLATGLVRKGAKRPCDMTGNLAVTWWPEGNDSVTADVPANDDQPEGIAA